MNAIETSNLTKTYPGNRRIPLFRAGSGAVTAIRDVDLTVEEGEVFGFLGPNGAGKSTTINVLLDYVHPTSGHAKVLGFDAQKNPLEIHDRIGVLPERLSLWPRLTARDHLQLAASAKDVTPRPEELLERVELSDASDQHVSQFSTGMAQRLGLAMALVGEPDILILDEPTAGLDPNGVRRLRTIIQEEVNRGGTVFFSSHVLDQVEAVCDRVGILRNGELVAVDTVDALRETVDSNVRLTVELDQVSDPVVEAARRVDGVTDIEMEETALVVTCASESVSIDVFDAVREKGATIEQFESQNRDLETVFTAFAGDGPSSEGDTDRNSSVGPEGIDR